MTDITYRNMLEHYDRCLSCGRLGNSTILGRLQRAHLAAGSGLMLRVKDPRAVLIVCGLCHERHSHSGDSVRIDGFRYRGISNANMLWLKRERDPGMWDWDYICSIWTGNPPEPEEPCL